MSILWSGLKIFFKWLTVSMLQDITSVNLYLFYLGVHGTLKFFFDSLHQYKLSDIIVFSSLAPTLTDNEGFSLSVALAPHRLLCYSKLCTKVCTVINTLTN